jgi:NAD(P)-dependent dehydrogenase (short-subunit alcohol dehydrogenase family)
MTKVTAAQLAADRIRVNCICPGLIATNIFASGLGIPSQLADTRLDAIAEAATHSQPIPRGGRPRDIAEAALYLASDSADWVTGQALVVDGGLTLGPQGMQQMSAFAPIIQALGIDAETFAAMAAARP